LVLDCARVVAYALVADDAPFTSRHMLYVDNRPLGRVPRLAVAVSLRADAEVHLFHCDQEWNVLGCSGGESVASTKAQAEANYPGISKHWVDMETSVTDALKYYDEHIGTSRCSFCGKREFEVEAMVQGQAATICRSCVERLSKTLDETGGAGDV
jgi:hypothetical protein